MFIAPIIAKAIERGNMFVRELCIKDLVNISHCERGSSEPNVRRHKLLNRSVAIQKSRK